MTWRLFSLMLGWGWPMCVYDGPPPVMTCYDVDGREVCLSLNEVIVREPCQLDIPGLQDWQFSGD